MKDIAKHVIRLTSEVLKEKQTHLTNLSQEQWIWLICMILGGLFINVVLYLDIREMNKKKKITQLYNNKE